jgi:hypothetical protein
MDTNAPTVDPVLPQVESTPGCNAIKDQPTYFISKLSILVLFVESMAHIYKPCLGSKGRSQDNLENRVIGSNCNLCEYLVGRTLAMVSTVLVLRCDFSKMVETQGELTRSDLPSWLCKAC